MSPEATEDLGLTPAAFLPKNEEYIAGRIKTRWIRGVFQFRASDNRRGREEEMIRLRIDRDVCFSTR